MANKLADLFVKVGADTGQLDKALTGAETRTKGFADKFGKQMKIAGTAMIGFSVAIAGLSIKAAMSFESAMREVNTMTLLSEEEFKNFSAEVQNLSKELGVNAPEAAKAMYQAISAGIPRENAISFLEIATKAAIGGVTDTATAVDGLTSVLNAFKIPISDAQKVADLMFTTVKGGKTTFEELAASMFQVAPLAAAAGVKFKTVSAALATMTKQGVPTNVATTQLRQAIQAIIKPTAEMKLALENIGYASGDALIKEKGLAKALDVLTEASGGSNEMLGKMFGSVEGLQAVLSLTGENAKTFANDVAAMENSAGAATDAFEQMEESTARQFEKMKAQFTDVAITLGNALIPVIKKLLDAVMPVIEKVAAWVEEHPKLTAGILAVVAGLGAMLIILPKIIAMITALRAITAIATIAQWAMNIAMSANPIGLIILAIAGLIALIVLLVKHFDKVKEVATRVFGTLKDIIIAPFNAAMRAIEIGINWLIRQINKIHVTIPDWVPVIGGQGIGFNIPEISLPQLAMGGIVTSPTMAMVGEKGPEAIVPLSGGFSPMNVYVTVEGSVLAERDLAETLRRQLILVGNRNYSTGL